MNISINPVRLQAESSAPLKKKALQRDLMGIARHYNFQNSIRKKDDPKKIDQHKFASDFLEWCESKIDSLSLYPKQLVEIAVFRSTFDGDLKKLSKLYSLKEHFGYGANSLVFKTKRLLNSAATTLFESLFTLKEIHGKKEAYSLIQRSKSILESKSETIVGAHDELVRIHEEAVAKEIGKHNPQVYRSAQVKSVHKELVNIHGEVVAKEIGKRAPQVYRSTKVKSVHKELVRIHGETVAKEIGKHNPQVYRSAQVQLVHEVFLQTG